jgi:hypothetical protein
MMSSHAYAAVRMILQVVVMVHTADNRSNNDDQRHAEGKPLLLSFAFAHGLRRLIKRRNHNSI